MPSNTFKMNIENFKATLEQHEPLPDFTDLQKALWYAAKGNWDAAHTIAQNHEGAHAFDHLHAYLHRVEGDTYNAKYWYRRSGTTMPSIPLHEELEALIINQIS